MRTIEEIQADMTALLDGAEGRPLTAEEVTQYEALEAEQKAVNESANVRSRHAAHLGPAGNAPRAAVVREAGPYNVAKIKTPEGVKHVFARNALGHDFSTDLLDAINNRGDVSAKRERLDAFIQNQFAPKVGNADVETADFPIYPHTQRPDLWEPQQDYVTPLWDMVGAGTIDGAPFDFPVFTSTTNTMVVPAVEKTEPASGGMVVELKTVTPSQVWGKVEMTRQAARRAGNPVTSGVIWDQMLREYYEDREAAVATFLATLTAAADIALTGTPAATPDNDDDQATVASFRRAVADLQFARGGNQFRAFAVHQDLYRVFARVEDDMGRPLFPQINPSNADGTSAPLYPYIDIAGVRAVPAWALGAGGQTTSQNSWLFDPAKVRGYASVPERLDWNFGATVQTANIPQLSFVTIGIYGDIAFGNTNINGVRQVTFDASV